MSKSDLTDLTLALHAETDKAVMVSETGDPKKAVWIPKSQCEVEPTGKILPAQGSGWWPQISRCHRHHAGMAGDQ